MLITSLIDEINLIIKNKSKITVNTTQYSNINLYTYEIYKNENDYNYILKKLDVYLKFFSYSIIKNKYIKILHYHNSKFFYVSINFAEVKIKDKNTNLLVISGPDGVGKSHYLSLVKK